MLDGWSTRADGACVMRTPRRSTFWFSTLNLGLALSLSMGVLLTAFGGTDSAHAAEPSPVVMADDPACVGKFRGAMCSLPNRSGGLCGPSRCGQDRPCLRCMVSGPETAGPEIVWVPMLSFGMVVAILGAVFWLRLRRNWNKGEQANKADKS